MNTRDLVWGSVLVMLGLIGCVTALIITGHDYNGLLVLLSTAAVIGGQVVNVIRTNGVGRQVEDVQFKVNGKMSALMRHAGIDPGDDAPTATIAPPAELPSGTKLSDGSVTP